MKQCNCTVAIGGSKIVPMQLHVMSEKSSLCSTCLPAQRVGISFAGFSSIARVGVQLSLQNKTHVIGNLRVGLVAGNFDEGELAVLLLLSAKSGGAGGLSGEEGDGDGLDDGHG